MEEKVRLKSFPQLLPISHMLASLNRAQTRLTLLGLLVTLLWADPASGANTYNGQLAAGHYTFNRPATASTLSGTRVFFHVVQFKVDGVGTVNVSATGTGFTPRVHLYQNGSFSPYNPLFQLYGVANGTLNAPGFAAGSSFVNHQLVISGSNPTDVGNFSVTITGPGTVTVDTTYDTTLAIGAQPEDGSINAGERVTLGVWASGREPHSFQWYGGPRPSSGTAPDPAKAIAGATNPTYQTPPLNGTTSFWALVTGNATTPATVRSRQATVNVASAPAQFSGSLTTQHGTWDRMTTINVPSGKICFFETCPFRVFTAGTYTFALNSVGFPASINLYSGTFFPATPGVNFWDNGVVAGAAGALNYSTFLSPGDYELVTSSASAGQVGT